MQKYYKNFQMIFSLIIADNKYAKAKKNFRIT